MLALGWRLSKIIAAMVILRTLFHIYQGPMSILPAFIWAGGFAYLFIKYRRVMPLVLAHSAWDLLVWIKFDLPVPVVVAQARFDVDRRYDHTFRRQRR